MAITWADVELWRSLRARGLLPVNPAVLELGQANWYGDVAPESISEVREGGGPGPDTWSTARAFYRGLLGPLTTFTAIDLNGPAGSLAWDLNEPLPLDRRFDLVINSGTAEHVFDQRQVFESIHDAAREGGLMVHMAPLSGWPNHGLYNYHPGLFHDLASANGYEIVAEGFWEYHSGRARDPHSELVMPPLDLAYSVALCKLTGEPFCVPLQGRYAGKLREVG